MKKLLISALLALPAIVLSARPAPETSLQKDAKRTGIVICFPAPPSCYGCHTGSVPYPCNDL